MRIEDDDEQAEARDERDLVRAPGRYLPSDLEAGVEHPTRTGWFATDYIDKDGNPLWWKPPGRVSVWIRRAGLGVVWFAGVSIALILLWERFGR